MSRVELREPNHQLTSGTQIPEPTSRCPLCDLDKTRQGRLVLATGNVPDVTRSII